ncbi:unnamed protein product [Caretta caretta]
MKDLGETRASNLEIGSGFLKAASPCRWAVEKQIGTGWRGVESGLQSSEQMGVEINPSLPFILLETGPSVQQQPRCRCGN